MPVTSGGSTPPTGRATSAAERAVAGVPRRAFGNARLAHSIDRISSTTSSTSTARRVEHVGVVGEAQRRGRARLVEPVATQRRTAGLSSARRARARSASLAVRYTLSVASGKTTVPMSRPSTTVPSRLDAGPRALALDERAPHPGVRRDDGDRLVDLVAAELVGEVDAVDGTRGRVTTTPSASVGDARDLVGVVGSSPARRASSRSPRGTWRRCRGPRARGGSASAAGDGRLARARRAVDRDDDRLGHGAMLGPRGTPGSWRRRRRSRATTPPAPDGRRHGGGHRHAVVDPGVELEAAEAARRPERPRRRGRRPSTRATAPSAREPGACAASRSDSLTRSSADVAKRASSPSAAAAATARIGTSSSDGISARRDRRARQRRRLRHQDVARRSPPSSGDDVAAHAREDVARSRRARARRSTSRHAHLAVARRAGPPRRRTPPARGPPGTRQSRGAGARGQGHTVRAAPSSHCAPRRGPGPAEHRLGVGRVRDGLDDHGRAGRRRAPASRTADFTWALATGTVVVDGAKRAAARPRAAARALGALRPRPRRPSARAAWRRGPSGGATATRRRRAVLAGRPGARSRPAAASWCRSCRTRGPRRWRADLAPGRDDDPVATASRPARPSRRPPPPSRPRPRPGSAPRRGSRQPPARRAAARGATRSCRRERSTPAAQSRHAARGRWSPLARRGEPP